MAVRLVVRACRAAVAVSGGCAQNRAAESMSALNPGADSVAVFRSTATWSDHRTSLGSRVAAGLHWPLNATLAWSRRPSSRATRQPPVPTNNAIGRSGTVHIATFLGRRISQHDGEGWVECRWRTSGAA